MIPVQDLNPRTRRPVVTTLLIALNIVVFLFEPLNSMEAWIPFANTWAIVPAQLVSNPLPEAYTIVTAMFLHGSIAHLLGNMLYLWIFGDNIEDKLGHTRFLIFYLVCGGVATLAQVYSNPSSVVPNVGASGAIAGVLGGYFLLFPMASVLTMVPVFLFRRIRLPAVVVLGIWFGLQLFSGWSTVGVESDTGGVAFWAHVGGFVAGVLLVKVFGNTQQLTQAQIDYFHRNRA